MNVYSLAVETTHSLNADIVVASTPRDAAKHFIQTLEIVDNEKITLIIAAVLVDENMTKEASRELEVELEKIIEAAVPELFAEGYAWTE